jgi:hypothetical protein
MRATAHAVGARRRLIFDLPCYRRRKLSPTGRSACRLTRFAAVDHAKGLAKPAALRREVRRSQFSIGSPARARRPRHSDRRCGPDSHGAFGGGNPDCSAANRDVGEPAFEYQLQIQHVVGPCATGWTAVPRRTLASTCLTRLSIRTVIARSTRYRSSSSPGAGRHKLCPARRGRAGQPSSPPYFSTSRSGLGGGVAVPVNAKAAGSRGVRDPAAAPFCGGAGG